MERKFIIVIALLSICLLAGISMVIGQNGGVSALGANLSRAAAGGNQWVQIQPRIAAENDAAAAGETQKSDTAVAKASQKATSAAGAKAKIAAVIWCDPAVAGNAAADTVVFNEIAWMGTDISYSDEWIEIKNRSFASADLSGWQLQNKSKKLKISFGSGEIVPAQGVYLLERTNDDTVPGVAANKIYTGSLANSNETLYLFDNNCKLLDTVAASSKWPAGDNTTKQTMERLADLNWAASAISGGTPGR